MEHLRDKNAQRAFYKIRKMKTNSELNRGNNIKKQAALNKSSLFRNGGAEGNRTPVRKQLGKNFSGCSLLFTFPHPDGNKHPAGFGSFIMHGARKALRTHVLHSNHTLARLVDLPGRMGA